ncbi:MAG: hypothetical protein R2713_13715 [Ilumatobacteraceae bacterium]
MRVPAVAWPVVIGPGGVYVLFARDTAASFGRTDTWHGERRSASSDAQLTAALVSQLMQRATGWEITCQPVVVIDDTANLAARPDEGDGAAPAAADPVVVRASDDVRRRRRGAPVPIRRRALTRTPPPFRLPFGRQIGSRSPATTAATAHTRTAPRARNSSAQSDTVTPVCTRSSTSSTCGGEVRTFTVMRPRT